MKRTFNIFCAAAFSAVAALSAACSSSGDKSGEFTKLPLELDQELVEFAAKNVTHTVDITSGNGGYSLSVYPEQATVSATLEGNTVTIHSHEYGSSNIVITDREGVQGHIQTMVYGEVQLNEYSFTDLINEDAYFNFGVEPVAFKITFSKPDFAVSTDYDIAITRDGNTVELIPYEAGDLTVRVTDAFGYYADVALEVTDRFGEFKESTDEVFNFTGMSSTASLTKTDNHRIENGYYVFRSDYANSSGVITTYAELRFPVSEGLEVGAKDGAMIEYALGFGGNLYPYTYDVMAKVVKNEGGKIWVVFYRTENFSSNGRLLTDVI